MEEDQDSRNSEPASPAGHSGVGASAATSTEACSKQALHAGLGGSCFQEPTSEGGGAPPLRLPQVSGPDLGQLGNPAR